MFSLICMLATKHEKKEKEWTMELHESLLYLIRSQVLYEVYSNAFISRSCPLIVLSLIQITQVLYSSNLEVPK